MSLQHHVAARLCALSPGPSRCDTTVHMPGCVPFGMPAVPYPVLTMPWVLSAWLSAMPPWHVADAGAGTPGAADIPAPLW